MPLSTLALRFVSMARMSVGAASLVAPVHTCQLFGIPLESNVAIIARLFGIRDFLLGLYLWRSTSAYVPNSLANPLKPINVSSSNEDIECKIIERVRRRDLEVALGFGLICDAVDVASSTVCILEGNLTDLAKVGVVGGAVIFAAIGAWQLRVLRRDMQE